MAPSDPIAFFNVQMGDLAESIGADVDVSLRLDFTRCAHHRRQIQALRLAGLHRDQILVALVNRKTHNGEQHNHCPPQSRLSSKSS